jgi:ribosomal protein S18 acetylase RimI-like enzyme
VKPPFELKPLDVRTGAEFISRTWKYSHEVTLSFIQSIVQRNESSGIYFDGKPVSGVTVSQGLITMLHTDEEHRKKNFGSLCMQELIKRMTEAGLIPASTVEINNIASKKFHDKAGMKVCQYVDYIVYNGLKKDD